MGRSLASIIGLLIFLTIVVGAGILIYRFIVSDDAQVAVFAIDRDGNFALDDFSLNNGEVFKIRNNSNENQTVKKQSDKTTLIEVDAGTSSRELTLPNDSKTVLYLAGDESETTSVKVGNPPKANSTSNSTTKTTTPPAATPPPAGSDLPNTGPENNLVFVFLAGLGILLYPVSRRILR